MKKKARRRSAAPHIPSKYVRTAQQAHPERGGTKRFHPALFFWLRAARHNGYVSYVIVSAILLVCIVMALSSWLCSTGRVGVNAFLGVRSPAVMFSAEIWRQSHRAAMPFAMITAGVVGCAMIVALCIPNPIIQLGIALCGLILLMIGRFRTAFIAQRHATRMRDGIR